MSGDRLASLINLDLIGANLFPNLGPGGWQPGDQIQMVAKYRTQFDEGSAAAPAASTGATYIPTLRRRRR